ncbi:MAG: RNA polymerase sporulation sigma factor SigG [Clostridium sp.]|nr:RNA polymerase sporulation sigma factor SigG [Clostridium sp.]
MTSKVEICGVDTSKLPVLKESEKMRLLRSAREGDKKAREQLITGNLRLVLSICGRFAGRGENPDDLFQVGCIGLMKSIDNFDIAQNVRFSTYAVPMILGEIRRYLRDNNPVRVSRSLRDIAYHAMQAKERLTGALQREPTVEEIAKELGLPREEVLMALEAIVEPISLQEPVYSDGGDTIYVMDQVRAPEGEDAWLDEIVLRESIGRLPEREKKILYLRFMQGHTQMEVAEEIGISQAQVSRLEKSALRSVRGAGI